MKIKTPIIAVIILSVLFYPAAILMQAPQAAQADIFSRAARVVRYDVSAINIDIPVNDWGDHNPLGMMYALSNAEAAPNVAQIRDPNFRLYNTTDPTVTYTPNAGFFGADSFTYTVKDNGAPALTSNAATVSVTVVPVENITVTTALFRRIGARWIVSGTGSIPGSVITVSIERGAQQVGTANVSALGIWSVALRNSTIIPVAGDTLRVGSTGGAVLRNVPLTIRD